MISLQKLLSLLSLFDITIKLYTSYSDSYHSAITLLSLFSEKRLNEIEKRLTPSWEKAYLKLGRASFRTEKSLFSTPEEPLPSSKHGIYQLQIRHIRGINDVLNSQSMVLDVHFPIFITNLPSQCQPTSITQEENNRTFRKYILDVVKNTTST